MDIIVIILIALGLSMDSFAVSVTNGLIINNLNIKKMFAISFSLAIFQALMPLLGWFAGIKTAKYIDNYDHWIAFILLSVIGIKMIYEGMLKKGEEEKNNLKLLTLLTQSFATSIDAFAAGISFAMLEMSIIFPVVIIGIITLAASMTGLNIGKYWGNKLGKTAEIAGGIVLLAIGTKILIEHLFFH